MPGALFSAEGQFWEPVCEMMKSLWILMKNICKIPKLHLHFVRYSCIMLR